MPKSLKQDRKTMPVRTFWLCVESKSRSLEVAFQTSGVRSSGFGVLARGYTGEESLIAEGLLKVGKR